MDRLAKAIAATGNPSVVGLDPTPRLLPRQLMEAQSSRDERVSTLAHAYRDFNTAIIDAIADVVPAVKPQIAMYEALGPIGLEAYEHTCEYAHARGLYVLGDIKRGDIGSTAAAYAKHLGVLEIGDEPYPRPWCEDAVTVNPYLGIDGVAPFIAEASQHDKDIFVLVRTSNPSSAQIQELELRDGQHLYERIADLVETWGASTRSASGYSRVGAVVGATQPEEGAQLRSLMPHTWFLVPGYGAQGGSARDVSGMFDEQGSGAIVNSSRGIIGAWRSDTAYDERLDRDAVLDLVGTAARRAAISMRTDLTQDRRQS